MATCHDLDRLLTSYLDAEAGAADRQAVERHLGECPPCARRAAAEGAARRVVTVRAAVLAIPAPEALRRRCAALAPGARSAGWWIAMGWHPAVLAAASAVMIGLAATVGYGVVTDSPTLLVAELTLDHLKCFALFEPREARGDPAAVAREMQADYGWQVGVPGSLPGAHLTLIGARRCYAITGRMAHVMYRHEGRAVSLFVLPGTSRVAARVELAGHVARIWSRHANTYVLLGSEGEPALQRVATYFQSAGF
jgi:anti-sigma factor RsiW